MTITSSVLSDLFTDGHQPIRISPLSPRPTNGASSRPTRSYVGVDGLRRKRTNLWSPDEHERFLEGLERFPKGPWRLIAGHVGSKSTRQTMTHAQKYRQKILRRKKKVAALATGKTSITASSKRSMSSEASSHRPRSASISSSSSSTSSEVSSSPLNSPVVGPEYDADLTLLASFLDELEPLEFMGESMSVDTPVWQQEQSPCDVSWESMLAWPVTKALDVQF